MVTVTPGHDGEPKVSLDYQVNVGARYNWDSGKSTAFPGREGSRGDLSRGDEEDR
ncbi:hypothetical protein ACFYPN_32825 [Streptomyces sp. NPDC005576]|uniref:hypothetical protein n=1 Tax=Streptomyces sp. NPDC005576 TaxID=3364726 RepID=UPI0036BA2A72